MGRVGAFDSHLQFIMGKNSVLADALSLSLDPINPGFRVDSETGSVPGSAETLAGDDRPLSHLVESPVFTIFFAIPRSECSDLASAALMSGSGSERSSSSSFVSRSAQTVSFPSPSCRNIQAVSFMRGDSPAICQVAGVLLTCSQADRFCMSSILTCWVPSQVVGFSELMSFLGPFCFPSFSS